MRVVYIATTGSSVAATVLLIPLVGVHRILFRQRRLQTLVSAAHRLASAGMVMLGIALTGVVVVVFDVVSGSATAAIIAGAIAGSAFIAFWLRCRLHFALVCRLGPTHRSPPRRAGPRFQQAGIVMAYKLVDAAQAPLACGQCIAPGRPGPCRSGSPQKQTVGTPVDITPRRNRCRINRNRRCLKRPKSQVLTISLCKRLAELGVAVAMVHVGAAAAGHGGAKCPGGVHRRARSVPLRGALTVTRKAPVNWSQFCCCTAQDAQTPGDRWGALQA